jgi:hypothetical protein
VEKALFTVVSETSALLPLLFRFLLRYLGKKCGKMIKKQKQKPNE